MLSRRIWFATPLLVGFALVSQAADDPYGDPIPEGPQARLGTARMRTHFGGPSTITPDGKFLVGQAPNGGVTYYEPATGKIARTVKTEGGFRRAGRLFRRWPARRQFHVRPLLCLGYQERQNSDNR